MQIWLELHHHTSGRPHLFNMNNVVSFRDDGSQGRLLLPDGNEIAVKETYDEIANKLRAAVEREGATT